MSLGRYTPKYFILFVAMVNGIVIVKLKDIKLTHRNPLHSYTLTMRKQKEKLRK